ncbi:type II secretion system major pseudopilin GspG [Candidatus Sumerlaeota bacterium]
MLRLHKSRQGQAFTLIEITIVVVIIGFIATLGSLAVMNRLKSAKLRIAASWVEGTGTTALDLYYTDIGMYPTTDQGLKALVKKPTSSPVPEGWSKPYLKKLDKDPWSNPYNYKYPSENGMDFDLWSSGPDGQSNTADDITNWGIDDE